MFAEALQKGLAAGGWVIVFVASVGIFAILCWIGMQAMVTLLGVGDGPAAIVNDNDNEEVNDK